MITLQCFPAFARRITATLVSTLAVASAIAQPPPAASASNAAAAKEEAIVISRFEVTTTQGKGYVATNSATGFKTNQELIKIPQSVTVVTRDLIDDIGATKTSDVLQFAGASQFYRGESIRLRGARTLNAYMDDAIENVPYSDNVNIDSYEVIRGPAGVLYANAGVDGSRPIITYCRIGERSSHTWFALSKILGYNVKNYDGSWTEYGNSVGVPITNPAGTIWAAK